MDDISELEELAYKGAEMPRGLNYEEQMLFLSMRSLYFSFKFRQINEEIGRKEKVQLIQTYKKFKFWADIYRETAAMRNKLAYYISLMNKSGCEMCKEAAAIWTHRDKQEETRKKDIAIHTQGNNEVGLREKAKTIWTHSDKEGEEKIENNFFN